MPTTQAEFSKFEKLLAQIGASLDEFVKFEHLDAQHPDKNWRQKLDIALPQQGIGIDAVVTELISDVIPNGSAVPNPGFTSFITTGATTVSTLASTAASIASPQRYLLTAFNFLEELSLQWLAEMFALPHLKGVYSSGGSVANLIALGGARQYAFEQLGHDVAARGVDRPVRVYASEECHHTIQRSGGVLGIGRRAICPIACDRQGRMRVEALQAALDKDLAAGIHPMAIVANAGTTNTGAIDPLQAIGEIAQRHNIWFHVDGAYGLPGILDARVADLYKGIELADSVIVDPHKWLGTSVGVATTLVRDRDILLRAFTQEPAAYLEGSATTVIEHSLDDFGIPYFDYGVELSAPPRGVMVWAILKEIGVDGLRERVIEHNNMARYIADKAGQHPNLELLQDPTLSICCFRYVDHSVADLDELNQRLHRRLVRENTYMPSTTMVNGQLAIRPCYVGARHHQPQDEQLLQAVLRIGANLVAEYRRVD